MSNHSSDTPSEQAEKTNGYQLLLPLDRSGQRPMASLRFALLLARALHGRVLVLDIAPADGTQATSIPQLPHMDPNGNDTETPYDVQTLETDDVAGSILRVAREQESALILLHWDGQSRGLRTRLGQILDPVVEEAPCPVALLQGHFETLQGVEDVGRIMVPVAGGSHADSAAEIAAALAQYCDARLKLVTAIAKDAETDEEANAQETLDEIFGEICEYLRLSCGVDGQSDAEADDNDTTREESDFPVRIDQEVVRTGRIEATIAELSSEQDVVFLGATNESVLNRLLVGSVAERLTDRIDKPVVVVREPHNVPQRWARRFWRTLDSVLPSVELEERLDVYKRIRRGARARSDFYLLMFCSVVIATMGLFLDSGAVIIGAMLVAPLMTPILALALGVVMGDRRLLRIAAASTALGISLAVAVSFVIAWFSPVTLLTTELESRTQPNLFDLTVAMAAGLAGAYSMVRQNLAAALPGVAIAAALVPPLAVVGITLASQRWEEARGAALLFGTNLVTITFAAALVYLTFGFFTQDDEQEERERIWQWGFLLIFVLFCVVSVPLTRTLGRVVNETTLNRTIEETLQSEFTGADFTLFNFDMSENGDRSLDLQVIVYGAIEAEPALRNRIDTALTDAVGRDVHVRLLILPVQRLAEEPPE